MTPCSRVVTANVNGIRAAARRGGLEWLAAAGADVLCLQEVRASDEQLAEVLAEAGLGHLHVAHTEAAAKGRAGVAVLTPTPQRAVRIGVGPDEFAGSGRWVEVEVDTALGTVTVASVYVHTGEATDEARQSEKYRFLDAVEARMVELGRPRARRQAILCGDLNVAHPSTTSRTGRATAARPASSRTSAPTSPAGSPSTAGPTSAAPSAATAPAPTRGGRGAAAAFDTDGGWRIDYVLATPGLAARAVSAEVGKAPSYAERWSDHAPLDGHLRLNR